MTGASNSVRVVGRYALHQAIASGGMATVFVGRLQGPVGFARTVAIKRLHPQYASDPEFVAMFLDEARLAARIRHPNVIPTLDVVATKGELFLVMEYVHGESVSKLVRMAAERDEPIPVRTLVSVLSGALQGLEAAHSATSERGQPLHIVHRDVSPQNILLGTDGQPRLLDFGIARAMGRSHTTQQGTIKGKLAYMPPEQLRGEELAPATDVYAAAVVLWEALVGRRLYTGSHRELVDAIIAGSAPPPSEALVAAGEIQRAHAVAPLDEVVMKALAPERANRWQSAREFARALEHVVPPASASQVSDWVQHIAGEALRARALIVAEIESSSAIDLSAKEVGRAIAAGEDGIPSRRVMGLRGAALKITLAMPGAPPLPSGPDSSDVDQTIDERATQPRSDEPSAALAPPLWDTLPLGQPLPSPRPPPAFAAASPPSPPIPPSLPSPWIAALPPTDRRPFAPAATFDGSSRPAQPYVITAPERRPRRKRRRARLIATGVGSGLAAMAVAALVAFGASSSVRNAVIPRAPSPAASAASPAPSAAPPTPSAAPSASVTSAASGTSSTPARPDPPDVPAGRGDAHKRPAGRSSTAPVPSCDPAFTYDKDGLKHYKDECL